MNSESSNKNMNSQNENNEININVNPNENNENNDSEIKYNQSKEILNNESDLNTSKINPEETTENKNYPKNSKVKKTKFKKFLFISIIISIVICAIVIGIIFGIKKPKKKEENEEFLIKHEISDMFFNSTKEEKIKTVFNTIGMKENRTDIKKINSEYLFSIVSEPNEKNNYFLGYVILLKRTYFLNEKEKNIFNNSNILNDNKNFKEIIQIKFTKNGTIIEQLFLNNSNEIYLNEINETISCLIPNFIDKNKINEKKNINFGVNENISWISNNLKGKLIFDNDPLNNSNYDSKINITIQDSNIIKSVYEKKLLIQNEIEEETNFNFTKFPFIFNDDLNDVDIINGIIDSIEINSTQILNFEKENSKEIDEKFKNKLKDLNFISYSSNKLRFLSKEEYENKNNSKNLRNQDLNEVDPFQRPFGFKYDLFKINVLGIQLSLISNIKFYTTLGKIIYKLYFQRGSKIFDVDEIQIEIENFSDVVRSYKYLTLIIYSYLKENILNTIDYSYLELLEIMETYLNLYENKLEVVLNFIQNLFKNYFKHSLDEFKENISKIATNGFKNLFNDLNIISILDEIENSLKNEEENNLKEFITNSETNLNDIITKYKSKLKNLEENVNKFINNSIESINNLKINEKIEFNYKIKDIFNKIDLILDSFNDNLANALDNEFLLLEKYVDDDIYMNKINNLLNDIEIVCDIFENNDNLKEIIDNSKIVSKIENIRKKYENIKNLFLNKIKESYEKFKNVNIKNEFVEVQNIKKNLNEKEKNLVDLVKLNDIYIKNYEIYNDDIKKEIKIENEISILKLNAYKNYIYNKLNEISTETFLNSNEINNIKKEIENLINNLENNDEIKLSENLNKILIKFNEISSSKNIEKIINEIKNKFSFDYLKTLISNYYNFIKENVIKKYSNFIDEIKKNSLEKYLSEPNELINNIKNLFIETEKNSNKENEKINLLINEKMNNIFIEIISKINNILTTEINYFTIKINSNFKSKINEFYTNSSNLIQNLQTKFSNYSFNNSFDLKSLILEKEENINLEISEIAENLRQNFYYLFCYENEILNISCPNSIINKMNENEKFNYQISKFQNIFNNLNLIQSSINNVINNENLNEISLENFINFFTENFDFNIITSQIKKNIEILKKNGIENTKSTINLLKEIIKYSFKFDSNFYEKLFKNFFDKTLIISKNLEEKFDLLFIKIQKKGREGYQNDLNYYKKKDFYYDNIKSNFEEEFNNFMNKYLNLLEEKKNLLLNNFNLTDELNNKLIKKFEDKIFNEINIYQNELNLFMTVRAAKNCKLLENEISLIEIVNEAINEIKKDFSSNIKIDLFKQFNFSFNKYKEIFNSVFNFFENRIKNQYRHFFNNYNLEMTKKSDLKSSNKITNLTQGIKNGFENGFNFCLENLEKIFEFNILLDSLNDDKKIDFYLDESFNKYSFKIKSYEIFDKIIDEDLKSSCENELLREKNSFQNNFFDYLKTGFNNTIVNFFKGSGKSYLNEIFLNDYEFNINSKLILIQNQIKKIDKNLNLFLNNFNEIDFYLNNSILNIYNNLKEKILYEINDYNKINNKILIKINQFNKNFTEKIIEYFKSFSLNVLSNDSFLNSLSDQIKILFPSSNVPYSLILDLRLKLNNLLDSLYFSDLKIKYQTNIEKKINEIVNEIENRKNSILIKINKLNKKNENFDLLNDFNELNNNINNFEYKFSFYLTENKKNLIENVLLNSTLKNYLIQIPIDYNNSFNNIKNEINNNVQLKFDSSDFIENLNENIMKFDIKNEKISDFIEDRNKSFSEYLNEKCENLEKEVLNKYSNEISFNSYLNLDNKRRLENKNIEIEIKPIKEMFNFININISDHIKNISNFHENINLKNKMNQMNKAIYENFLIFDNSVENYLKLTKFFLNSSFNNYQKNISNIYTEIGNVLQNSFNLQITNLKKFSVLNDQYKLIYFDEIKPKLIEKINNLLKNSSKILISKYLKNQIDKGQKNYTFNKTSDLKNINEIQEILGSTKLNYLINVQNTIFEWGFNFTTDAENYKFYLDIFTSGHSNGSIILSNEFYKSSIEGNFGNTTNGMNITFDLSGNENGVINYYTKHNDNIYKKTLYKIKTFDSWEKCENENDCFETENKNFCPKIIKIENEMKNIVNYNENKVCDDDKYYLFNGLFENDLCYYDNYFYSIEEVYFEFNSEISKNL